MIVMKIINYVNSGATRTLKTWKWILIIWFSTLLLVSILALPVKSGIKSILGLSMVTEKLQNGINLDVLANSGTGLTTLMSFLTSGILLVLFFGLLMNVFFSGGLFATLKSSENKFTASNFFGGGGSNFWSFLVITLIICLIILVLAFLIIGLPVIIASGSDSEGAPYKTFWITAFVFLMLVPILLLAGDYARAWQAGSPEKTPFKAIGKGFGQTFRHFFSSYTVMLVLMFIQMFFTWEAFKIVGNIKPVTGGGIFLLFLLSQLLFVIKLLLRVCRYGSVTAMFEQNQ
jgi:hypothetical protein